MVHDITPEIKEMAFPPLSKTLLESVLKRTLEYDLTEHVLAIEAWRVISGANVDPRSLMRDVAAALLADSWYLLSKEPTDNGVPSLVFQKERANVLLAGARSGDLGMMVALITAGSKPDLLFAVKSLERLVGNRA